jgi:glutathione peroxidase-family protein
MCPSFAPSSNPANIKKTFFKIGFPSNPYSHHYISSEEDLMTANISTICQKEYNMCFVIFNQNSGFQKHSTLTRVDFELKSVGPAP